MRTSIAIYPGSFDPVTNGHLDLIERGEKMFDTLIVAILRNVGKQPLFSVPERIEMMREVTKQWKGVEVEEFDGLLVDYARKRGAGVILRGIRAVSDYEYELQMALMNRKLEPRLETVKCPRCLRVLAIERVVAIEIALHRRWMRATRLVDHEARHHLSLYHGR